ncbi:MAG TPA: DUF4142 domain-containing protein, partial [Chitinophagaceae bacterium]|nr:DUF4142 domain-containing protein [Chitinophagaceae bacterium]
NGICSKIFRSAFEMLYSILFAYLDAMIKGHTEVLSMIDSKLLTTAKNDALKAHLTETRGHVSMHLEQAKKLKG